jgi:hypothetical protein
MAINRLLERTSLCPERIRLLHEAYEQTLLDLDLVDCNDGHLTEIVAKKILEVSQTGVNDSAQLSKLAIKALGVPKLPR